MKWPHELAAGALPDYSLRVLLTAFLAHVGNSARAAANWNSGCGESSSGALGPASDLETDSDALALARAHAQWRLGHAVFVELLVWLLDADGLELAPALRAEHEPDAALQQEYSRSLKHSSKTRSRMGGLWALNSYTHRRRWHAASTLLLLHRCACHTPTVQFFYTPVYEYITNIIRVYRTILNLRYDVT